VSIHDDAEAARRAVYEAEFTRLQAEITRLKAAQGPAVPPVKLPTEQPPVVVVPPVTSPPTAGRLGQHWATDTPRPGQVPGLEVDPDWNALRTAAGEYGRTREYLIRPGTLTGRGAGSSMPGEIANLNVLGPNGERILIRPRDGYGTVKLGKGVSFVNVQGLSFMGIQATDQAVLFRNSKHSAWGWSEINMCRATANDKSACEDIEFIEPVSRGILIASDDRHRFVTANAGSSMARVSLRGGYGSTIYIPTGSAAHCDHLQVERQTGGGTITGITVDDYVAYGHPRDDPQEHGRRRGAVHGGALPAPREHEGESVGTEGVERFIPADHPHRRQPRVRFDRGRQTHRPGLDVHWPRSPAHPEGRQRRAGVPGREVPRTDHRRHGCRVDVPLSRILLALVIIAGAFTIYFSPRTH
jgi:hypothetical protein